MKCVTGNPAQYLCLNRYCDLLNSFVCSQPEDRCKENHQSCSLINISFVLKKAQAQSVNSSRFDGLVILREKLKALDGQIERIFSSSLMFREINKLLSQGRPLTLDDKDKINRFLNDQKANQFNTQAELQKLEKQLTNFEFVINEYRTTRQDHKHKQKHPESRIKASKIKEGSSERKKNKQSPKMGQGQFSEEQSFQFEPFVIEQKTKTNILEQMQEIKTEQKHPKEKSEKRMMKQPKASSSSKKEQGKKSLLENKYKSQIKSHVPVGPFFSRVTNDIETISSFFWKKFQEVKLLYRASEHEFLVNKFHERCDGHANTLVLIQTQSDGVIGGYTPVPWRSSGEWLEDEEGSSFLFSLTLGQRYPLQAKEKAIWCNRAYGPSFGYPDLQIADKAAFNSKSCSNFPHCYNNGDYEHNSETAKHFCGSKNGHFRIKQWEVYELMFD